MAEQAKWYVVHTYSGYENTVKATIERTVESRSLQEWIHAVSIPLETVTEVTESGVSKTFERKVFPGYVLVKMVMTDDSWYIIKNVRGVTGFVGSGTKPTPLTEEEILALGVEKREIVVNYDVGDTVRINDGPLTLPPQCKRWKRTKTKSAFPYPCLAARRLWSWSLIRWRLYPSKTHRIAFLRSCRGRGASPRQKCA